MQNIYGKESNLYRKCEPGVSAYFEVINLILYGFLRAFWQLYSSGIYDLVRSRNISIAQRRA